MKRFVLCIGLTVAFGAASVLNSQEKNLKEAIKELSGQAARSYVGPIVSAIGADLNSGWFHRAPRATFFGLDLEFGGVIMGTFFKDENRKFAATEKFRFDSAEAALITDDAKLRQQDAFYNLLPTAQRDSVRKQIINQIRSLDFTVGIAGATAIGNKQDTLRATFSDQTFTVTIGGQQRTISVPKAVVALGFGGAGPLSNAKGMPLLAPQLTIGTFLGSQFTFRYLPTFKDEDSGLELKYFGFGVQHNPGVWLGDILPLEISVSFFTQKLEGSPILKATATAFGINASKRLGWGFLNITPYAGYMLESSSLEFSYDLILDTPTGKVPQKVEFKLIGENKNRVTVGLSVKVLIVNINADYNLGKYKSASAGLMFII